MNVSLKLIQQGKHEYQLMKHNHEFRMVLSALNDLDKSPHLFKSLNCPENLRIVSFEILKNFIAKKTDIFNSFEFRSWISMKTWRTRSTHCTSNYSASYRSTKRAFGTQSAIHCSMVIISCYKTKINVNGVMKILVVFFLKKINKRVPWLSFRTMNWIKSMN